MEESKKLKQEALSIIKELDLLKLLEQHGETKLVGSVALDLVVKLDIDVHVYIGEKDLLKTTNAVYQELLNHPKIDDIRISDYRTRNGIKIGIDKFTGHSGDWSVDIWLTTDKSTTGFETLEKMLSQITDENRKNILTIKRYYHDKKMLREGFSLKIYQAVLDQNVKTVTEFKKLPTNN